MKFRVVRFMLNTGDFETIATSLSREDFSMEDIKELYHKRWRIETAFRHLKYDLGLSHLHGKSDEFAMQEILAALIMNNFCSRIVNTVTVEQKEENTYEYKVNLKMAIELCKQFIVMTTQTENNLSEILQDILNQFVRIGVTKGIFMQNHSQDSFTAFHREKVTAAVMLLKHTRRKQL